MILTNVFVRAFPFIFGIIITFFIGYILALVFRKISPKLTFLVPILCLIAFLSFIFLGFLSMDWGRLGYLIFAGFSLIAFIGSLVASLLLNKKHRQN